MTAQELRETGQKLFREKQYAAAARLLVSAVEASPQDEQVWQELVLGFSWSGEHDKSADFVKQAVRAYPRSDWLWRQLGSELITLDRLEEAGNALQNAKGLNLNAPWLWRYLATLHEKQSDNAKEIEAWENLGELEELDSNELNKLGIAYYKLGNFGKALGLYRRSAAKSPSAAAYFNMGLVYNHAEFSQDADAADACRRALALTPTFQEAINPLEATKQKLLPLAERARSEAGVLVQRDNYFRFYLNPFEVLPIALDGSLDELGDKAIQRATKKLLAEIRLNDGRVEWLEGHAIDESRALALADEICDAKKQRFHRTIFDNHPLLRFLTRGEIEHFLYSDEYFPKEVLELWDHEPEFRGFISKPFARQYNFVLSLAIQGRVLAVVEAMFDGRRWVEQKDEDICFAGAHEHAEMLIGWVKEKAQSAATTKPDYSEIAAFLENLKVAETFNLLPTAFFRDYQIQIVEQIRLLAIAAYNEHSDPELSASLLRLCKRFNFKSADLNKRLEDDFRTIEELLPKRHTKDTNPERGAGRQQSPKANSNGERVTEQTPNWVWGKRPTEHQGGFQPAKKGVLWRWAFVALLILIAFVTNRACEASKTASRGNSFTPTYTTPSFPIMPSSESGTAYRAPSYATTELHRERKAIEDEKANAERMATQLENLGRDLEWSKLYLDRSSPLAIDQFNAKVENYNALLERVRIEDRLVNQMVENYNAKLPMYGR